MNRGLNINSTNSNLMSTTDLCGQRVLGMNGSLINYINTGNAGSIDTFRRTTPKNEEKQKKKINFGNIVKVAVAGLGIVAAGTLLYKNSAKVKKIFDSAFDSLRNFKDKHFNSIEPENVDRPKKGFFERIRDNLNQLFRDDAKDTKLKDGVSSIASEASDTVEKPKPKRKLFNRKKSSKGAGVSAGFSSAEQIKPQVNPLDEVSQNLNSGAGSKKIGENVSDEIKLTEPLSDKELEDIKVLCGGFDDTLDEFSEKSARNASGVVVDNPNALIELSESELAQKVAELKKLNLMSKIMPSGDSSQKVVVIEDKTKKLIESLGFPYNVRGNHIIDILGLDELAQGQSYLIKYVPNPKFRLDVNDVDINKLNNMVGIVNKNGKIYYYYS